MSHLSNFLNETEHHIRMLDKTPDSITYIGTDNGEYSSTWEEFRAISDFIYNRGGSDGIIIARDLVIVFNDYTTMYRTTDDYGFECWGTINVTGKRIIGKPIISTKQLIRTRLSS